MVIKNLRKYAAVLLIAIGLLGLTAPKAAHADAPSPSDIGSGTIVAPLPTVSCSDSPFSGVGSYSVPADVYDIYARLGSTTAPESDVLYAQAGVGSGQPCQKIGQANLQNNQWTKIGTYDARNGQNKGVFQLVSLTSGILQSFNQPSILLVSQTNPACQPTTECFVNVDGQQGAVRATAINGSSDTVFVVRAVNPKNDTIKQVYYYTDNRLSYVRPNLQPFDMRYARPGEHQLSRVVLYKSGQRVVINQTINRDWVSFGFSSLVVSLFYNQKGLLQYLFGLSVVLLIISTIIKIIRAIHRRARWRRDHDARIKDPVLSERIQDYTQEHFHPHLHKGSSFILSGLVFFFSKLPLICLGLFSVVILNNYIISLNQVSGPSMNSTFHDGQTIVINRLGQTYSEIFKRDYLPKRGDVVVFRRVMDVNDPHSADGSELVIKRIIGLPGERVTVHDSTITIYNDAHPNGFQPDKGSAWAKTMHLNDNGQSGTTSDIDVTLSPGEVFACGDNRPDSVDSRSFGPINVKNILGNVIYKS